MKPTKNTVPRHIAIILDGNRRFAKRLMLKPWKGHEWGAKKVEKIIEWIKEFNIKELTLYAFSIENMDRPKDEFNFLMNLFEKELRKTLEDKRITQYGIRINFLGRIYLFPSPIQKLMLQVMEKTKYNRNYTLNLAMAYGGRSEVVDATKKIAEQIQKGQLKINEINEEIFSKNLYTESEPDLIIRTSESRLSGFMIYQSAYSEIVFLPNVLWPEFTKKHFVQCLKEYEKRDRRFGI